MTTFFNFDPLLRPVQRASRSSSRPTVSADGTSYSVTDHGWTAESPGGTVYNTCLYNASYAFLTPEELSEYPTIWLWRSAVLGQLDKGGVRELLKGELERGVGVYGTRSFEEYKRFMSKNSAMGGPLELWAAAQLLRRPFRIIVDDGTGDLKVHPIMGSAGLPLPEPYVGSVCTLFLRNRHWQALAPVLDDDPMDGAPSPVSAAAPRAKRSLSPSRWPPPLLLLLPPASP